MCHHGLVQRIKNGSDEYLNGCEWCGMAVACYIGGIEASFTSVECTCKHWRLTVVSISKLFRKLLLSGMPHSGDMFLFITLLCLL